MSAKTSLKKNKKKTKKNKNKTQQQQQQQKKLIVRVRVADQRVTPLTWPYQVGVVHDVLKYRAAAFDVTGRKTFATLFVILRFAHKIARQESSQFYSDLRNANRLELTKY